MSINNHTANIPVEDAAYRQMMGLFEEASLRERFSRTLRGLNAPYDSGDHKYAVLQIQRLAAPVLALLLTAMLVSLLLAIQQRGTAPPPGRIVAISEPLNAPPPAGFCAHSGTANRAHDHQSNYVRWRERRPDRRAACSSAPTTNTSPSANSRC